MSNHDPIIPTINDQTTTIPATPDFQCPPNVPAVMQIQRYNLFYSQSNNQSQNDGADSWLAFFCSEEFCVQSPMGNSPSITLEPTPVNASPQLSQQFFDDAFGSGAHSKTEKSSWAINCLTDIAKKPKKLYSPRASMLNFIRKQAIDSL